MTNHHLRAAIEKLVQNVTLKWIVLKRYDVRLLLESARTGARLKLRPLPAQEYLGRLDLEAIEAIRARSFDADNREESKQGLKYLNAQKYVPVSTRRAQELNLDRLPPQRILDLGSGAGYFPWVCRNLGHEVLGLDTADVPAYAEMMELLEVPRITWRIESLSPLPDLGARFDLITAFQIRFNRANGSWKSARWSLDEWDFFLRDLSTHLAPQGRIFLRFNKESRELYITRELSEFFRARGGDVRRTSVSLKMENGKFGSPRGGG